MKHTMEVIHPVFKLRADVTRIPKQEYQWPHKKDSCTSKKIFKKDNLQYCWHHTVNGFLMPDLLTI